MNRKLFTTLLMVLLTIVAAGVTGCESDDEAESQSCNDNAEVQHSVTNAVILGVWTLRMFERGWAQKTEFLFNEVLCIFNQDGTVEVKNETSIDLSPFLNKGVSQYSIKSEEEICINSVSFNYKIMDGALYLSKNVDADGESYYLVKIIH